MADFPEVTPPVRVVSPTTPGASVRNNASVRRPDDRRGHKLPSKPEPEPEIDHYSLVDIPPEGAANLLNEPLMQNAPDPEQEKIGLGDLKRVLEKVRDNTALAEADNAILSRAGIIVNPRPPSGLTGAAEYELEEQLAQREAFNRAAAPYATGVGVVRA